MANPKIQFDLISGFVDKSSTPVPVLKASAGGGNFGAFVYQCKLNLDKDGAPNTYAPVETIRTTRTAWGRPIYRRISSRWKTGVIRPEQLRRISSFWAWRTPVAIRETAVTEYKNFKDGTGNFYWASVVCAYQGRGLQESCNRRPG